MGTQVNKLTADKQYKLMKLVEAEYTERRQTDTEFAVYATEKLGFHVNLNNVFGARRGLGVEATRSTMTSSSLESRLVLLEKRLAELEERVNQLSRLAHIPRIGGAQ